MPNIVVTGAGSGLGQAFVQEYSKDSKNHIFALDRFFSEAWISTIPNRTNIHTTILDITDESAITQFTTSLPQDVKQSGIQIVIHSAGVRGLVSPNLIREASDVSKSETYSAMDVSTLQSTFAINTIGTFLLIRALLPFFSSNINHLNFKSECSSRPKVIIMGSRMGSITSNTAGGGYAYRASKAALNAIVKSFALDFKHVRFLIVHPGRVETGLINGGIKEDQAFGLREVMPELMSLIEGLETEKEGEGHGEEELFVDRWGKRILW